MSHGTAKKKKVIVFFFERLWVLVQKKTRQGEKKMLTSLAHSRCSMNIWERNSAERMSPSLIGLLCLNYSAPSEMWGSHPCLPLSLPLSLSLKFWAPPGQALPNTEPDLWQSSANLGWTERELWVFIHYRHADYQTQWHGFQASRKLLAPDS